MKSPTPEAQYAEGIFQMQYHICAVNFISKYQGQAEYDTTFENSLTIYFGNIYFHNSLDW